VFADSTYLIVCRRSRHYFTEELLVKQKDGRQSQIVYDRELRWKSDDFVMDTRGCVLLSETAWEKDRLVLLSFEFDGSSTNARELSIWNGKDKWVCV